MESKNLKFKKVRIKGEIYVVPADYKEKDLQRSKQSVRDVVFVRYK